MKNLAFSTDDKALHHHFDLAAGAVGGALRSATVAKKKAEVMASSKKGSKADQGQLSMGFGFVECSTEQVAKAVIKQLQVPMGYFNACISFAPLMVPVGLYAGCLPR